MAKTKNKKSSILVIVESPAKAKTINKYLGKDYKVVSSMGHVIDLPKSRLGIDVDDNFKPEYITIRGKGKILTELKRYASKSKSVLLASDNDREGEAIAYHIKRVLNDKYPDLDIKRIVFNEITKDAIINSLDKQRIIEDEKVNAQKTRRLLDRLVGYNISPILWEKVKNGLSAGRVQSVALKIICEREDEVDKFVPAEYWSIDAEFSKNKKTFIAELSKIANKKPDLKSKKEVDDFLNSLNNDNYIVDSIKETIKQSKPVAPFITSKLQQAAANKLGYTSRKTMSIAQQLYEGIDIGKETVGLITYMRTDSTRISPVALDEARKFIVENHPEHLPDSANIYSKAKGSQDAHEAIRPTSVFRTPENLKQYLSRDQYKIYSIIWERFVSSQMKPSENKTTSIRIINENSEFKISKTSVVNKGFTEVLKLLKSKKEKQKTLPKIKEGDKVDLIEYLPAQHFTQPPPRYTDASIVKFLEEKSIGRPSTYAPIISTLLSRYYVTRKSRQLIPTVLGKLVNQIVSKNFSDIVNVDFTASMEKDLDEIAGGRKKPIDILKEFYSPFKTNVDKVAKNLEDHKRMFDEETDEVCEKCGSKMMKKLGRYGFFLACSAFPDCRNSKSIPLAECPREGCNGKIIARKKKQKGGREFYGCTNYPECDFVTWFKPTDKKCPECGKFLIEKNDKIHGTYKLCIDEENCGFKQLEEHSDQDIL